MEKEQKFINALEDKVLRWQVNDRLLNKLRKNPVFSPEDIQALIGELTLRRIESTELHQVREELEESKNQYQDLFNLYAAGYLVINDDNTIQEANRVIAKDLNEKIEGLIGVDILNFVAPDSQDSFNMYITNLLRSRSTQTCGLYLRKRNGETFPVKLTGQARKDFKGKNDLRIIISKAPTNTATENSLLVVIDMEGNIVLANYALCKTLGYSHQELLGQSIADFLLAKDRSRIMTRLLKARMGILKPVKLIFGIRCKNQTCLYFHSIPRLIKIHGTIPGFIITLQKTAHSYSSSY